MRIFSPIRSILGVFSVSFFEAHHLSIIHSSFQLSFSKSYRCIVQVLSNQLVISSFSCIKSPQLSSFVFQVFLVNCAFATFIFNSYGGSFKISLPCSSYQFICCSNPTGGSLKTFSSLRYISFNPFYENK